jgi:hypothetical protein
LFSETFLVRRRVTGRNLTVMDSATGDASLGYVWNCHSFQIDHSMD